LHLLPCKFWALQWLHALSILWAALWLRC
jgi:hypothetical protein